MAKANTLILLDVSSHAKMAPDKRLGGNIAQHVGDLPGHAHRRMAEGDDRAAVLRDGFVVDGIKRFQLRMRLKEGLK